MRTTEDGEPVGPARLLEMLGFRFGAFKTIAYTACELAEKDHAFCLPMDRPTALAILEFAEDLEQTYEVVLRWGKEHGRERAPHR